MITILFNGKTIEVEGKTVEEALKEAEINPEEVLVKQGKTIIPDSEPIKKGETLEVLTIISGG